MFNRTQIFGHSVHAMGPSIIDKKAFSSATFLPDLQIVEGKGFTNPNFVNKQNAFVHSLKNQLNTEKSQQKSQNSGHISDSTKNPNSSSPSQKQNGMEKSDLTASEKIAKAAETPCVLSGIIFGCTFDFLNDAECSLQKCINSVVNKRRSARQISVSSEDSIVFESCDYSTDESDVASDGDEGDNEENEDGRFEIDRRDVRVPASRRVRFASEDVLCTVHPMVQWSYAYRQARVGPWERYARDSERFKCRIMRLENILKPIFDIDHRKQIYDSRFKEND